MKAKVSTDVPRGVLWSPRQLIGLNNEPLNSLVKSKTQKIKWGSIFNSTLVKIKVECRS